MSSDVVLLYSENLSDSEINIIKIINFMGGTVIPIQLRHGSACEESAERVGGCLIVSAKTLSEIKIPIKGEMKLQQVLMGLAPNLLVYGFESVSRHNRILEELTFGCLSGVQTLASQFCRFRVAENYPEISQQFTGLDFGTTISTSKCCFIEEREQAQCSSIIRIEGHPYFVRTKNDWGQLYLLATSEIADLDVKVANDTSVLQFFPDLAPLMMFLRGYAPDEFWHNDKPTACFIVDDPLLKKRYGFLEYERLFEVMQQKRFSTSVAFIPWNYRRSSRQTVDLFATYPEQSSLSIHGCDHTAREFGGNNYQELREQALKALYRMELHHRLHDLGFDDVMIFPQGIFSSVAMKALKSSGYLAAVNSTAHANDCSGMITLRDLADGAVTRFSNFPLFIRRYPANAVEVAFDLFLGKPALLVEHHRYFRDGYQPLADCIDKINSFDKRLEWTSLASICSRMCLKRVSKDGDIHVKFFTDRFWMENESEQPKQYLLLREHSPEDPVTHVTVNGSKANLIQNQNDATISLSLMPGKAAEVRVQFGGLDRVSTHRGRNLIYSGRVFARRRLSEFRDNYMDTNSVMNRIEPGIRNFFAKL